MTVLKEQAKAYRAGAEQRLAGIPDDDILGQLGAVTDALERLEESAEEAKQRDDLLGRALGRRCSIEEVAAALRIEPEECAGLIERWETSTTRRLVRLDVASIPAEGVTRRLREALQQAEAVDLVLLDGQTTEDVADAVHRMVACPPTAGRIRMVHPRGMVHLQ